MTAYAHAVPVSPGIHKHIFHSVFWNLIVNKFTLINVVDTCPGSTAGPGAGPVDAGTQKVFHLVPLYNQAVAGSGPLNLIQAPPDRYG